MLKFKSKAIGKKNDNHGSYSQCKDEDKRRVLATQVRREMAQKRRLKLAQSMGKTDINIKDMILDKEDKFRFIINQSCNILSEE